MILFGENSDLSSNSYLNLLLGKLSEERKTNLLIKEVSPLVKMSKSPKSFKMMGERGDSWDEDQVNFGDDFEKLVKRFSQTDGDNSSFSSIRHIGKKQRKNSIFHNSDYDVISRKRKKIDYFNGNFLSNKHSISNNSSSNKVEDTNGANNLSSHLIYNASDSMKNSIENLDDSLFSSNELSKNIIDGLINTMKGGEEEKEEKKNKDNSNEYVIHMPKISSNYIGNNQINNNNNNNNNINNNNKEDIGKLINNLNNTLNNINDTLSVQQKLNTANLIYNLKVQENVLNFNNLMSQQLLSIQNSQLYRNYYMWKLNNINHMSGLRELIIRNFSAQNLNQQINGQFIDRQILNNSFNNINTNNIIRSTYPTNSSYNFNNADNINNNININNSNSFNSWNCGINNNKNYNETNFDINNIFKNNNKIYGNNNIKNINNINYNQFATFNNKIKNNNNNNNNNTKYNKKLYSDINDNINNNIYYSNIENSGYNSIITQIKTNQTSKNSYINNNNNNNNNNSNNSNSNSNSNDNELFSDYELVEAEKKLSKIPLHKLINNLQNLYKKQSNCKYFQKILKKPNSGYIVNTLFFNKIKEGNVLYDISIGKFSNYLIQRIIPLLNHKNLIVVNGIIIKNLKDLALNPYGTRVIQTLILEYEKFYKGKYVNKQAKEMVENEEMVNAFIINIKGLISILIKDLNGSFIFVVFSVSLPNKNQFIYDYLNENVVDVSTYNNYSCCALQKLLDIGNLEQRTKLMDAVSGNSCELIKSQNGCYVLNFILMKRLYSVNDKIIKNCWKNIIQYCKGKYSSSIIERSLGNCSYQINIEIIKYICSSESCILELLTDSYGNYIVQRIIEICQRKIKTKNNNNSLQNMNNLDTNYYLYISNVIKKIIINNKQYIIKLPFGHKLMQKLENYYPELSAHN